MSNSHPRHAIQPLSQIPDHQANVLPRKWVVGLHRIRAWLSHRGLSLARFWCTLRSTRDNLFHRTKTLPVEKQLGVLLGPWFEVLPTGCLVRNERTNARALGIQEITSRYPATSTAPLEMFLAGFDKGEQFALGRGDKPAQVVCESSVASHFQHCPNNTKHDLTIDMLKRQWYKSQYESPRHQDPSQSD
jgi:hypothetical protein